MSVPHRRKSIAGVPLSAKGVKTKAQSLVSRTVHLPGRLLHDGTQEVALVLNHTQDNLPIYTTHCNYHGIAEGFLHLYRTHLLFSSQRDPNPNFVIIRIALPLISTYRKSRGGILIMSKRRLYQFSNIDSRRHLLQLIKEARNSLRRAAGGSQAAAMEQASMTDSFSSDDMDEFVAPEPVRELMDDPIVRLLHDKASPKPDLTDPENLTMTYEKTFPVPLKVVSAIFFSNKSKFFDELHPPGETVQDYGTWTEAANEANKVVQFTTTKQAFTVSVRQDMVVHWGPDGGLVHQVDNTFQGFPGAPNMKVTTYWKLVALGSATMIRVSGVVNFSGFFIGKDKARRQSIEGIAESCEMMEKKLFLELGIADMANEAGKAKRPNNQIAQISTSVAYIQQRLLEVTSNMRPLPSKDIFLLTCVAAALQVVMLLVIYTRFLFGGGEAPEL